MDKKFVNGNEERSNGRYCEEAESHFKWYTVGVFFSFCLAFLIRLSSAVIGGPRLNAK